MCRVYLSTLSAQCMVSVFVMEHFMEGERLPCGVGIVRCGSAGLFSDFVSLIDLHHMHSRSAQ